jgi:membrane protease YdiL (CAAX protease family)
VTIAGLIQAFYQWLAALVCAVLLAYLHLATASLPAAVLAGLASVGLASMATTYRRRRRDRR